jgi:hypothetical protein
MSFFNIAAFGCTTFKGHVSSMDSFHYQSYDNKTGYWRAYINGTCVKFDNSDVGGAFKFGRFIGNVGGLMIAAIFIAIAIASFFRYPKPKLVFRVIGICMGVISFFSFLLLVGLSEDDSLQLAGGGVLAILSAFIWAGGAVSMFFCMNERERVVTPKAQSPQTTTTTETANKEVIADMKNNTDTSTNDYADDEV